ncbi:hypothetical protein VC83_01017 [Pseudogymnoascus destructans]|uniref:Survival protein SurE-like phosphatase/nucleotidase domain-containing protein n=1 Tax=Pseudogymnoascus destructans TaxID=655981 RepID=A0A177AJD4_9PEZI|nr:uncharacterized protein VC83_01017 [Pseudogymnoascus destructans]OAF62187.1 hypothetical protein VC83_01017 [Pseudogymnoascus destructans]
MHILVVNDDGPPSNQSSPYVHSLVNNLLEAGHVVSIILPREQRSWIGKAHIIGQTVKPTYFRPGTLHEDDGVILKRPSPAGDDWVLVDGTPASCVQIGLYYFFQERGPVDVVLSGPNYGRNTTACFALSSGTLGGALEAAVCKRKAIALSYAFLTREHDPKIIAGASRLSVKIVEHLVANWDANTDVYTVNVPLVPDVENKKIFWTDMLQNYWGPGSCFEAVEDTEDADEEEYKIREGEVEQKNGGGKAPIPHQHRNFKWSPRFTDVYKSVEDAPPGNDGWVVKEGFTSVTPLKANFMQATGKQQGEITLTSEKSNPVSLPQSMQDLSLAAPAAGIKHFNALIDYGDTYVQPLILSALSKLLPKDSYTLISPGSIPINSLSPTLHIQQYEELPFDTLLSQPTTTLANAYIIRKALIRKHYLSATAHAWGTKNPSTALAKHIAPTVHFEVDYAEFLDDALVECFELHEMFARNADKEESEREWWILKPGMSDRGQGIRLFDSEETLQSIFDEWEAERPESDDEEEDDGEANMHDGKDYIMTSQLRHFITQPYIHPPLLLQDNPHKFHIRTYVLAIGALTVYVYRPMLALFAGTPYTAPAALPDLRAHLTNTCLQDGSRDGSVAAFWELGATQPGLPSSWQEDVFAQICEVTGELFEGAARTMGTHFQALPNAFEVFGVDFVVDKEGGVWLLEVNAFPDFGQTGEAHADVVEGLWEGVVDVAVKPFFGGEARGEEGGMVEVRKIDLGRR